MYFFLIIIVLLIVCLFIFQQSTGDKVYKEAQALEEQAKYKEACYMYAVAWPNCRSGKDCASKIKYLWEKHGPFDYQDVEEAGIQRYSPPSGERGDRPARECLDNVRVEIPVL